MSIAAITSSFITAVRERAAPVAPAPAEPVAEVQGSAKGGRRHQLVDAMQQVLGGSSVDSKTDQQTVFRFAHALMHDLRKIETGAEGATTVARHAQGRRGYNDLPQRLEALATASAPAATGELRAPLAVEMPLQPNPVTATSAGLHLMQVPTSRLLEAYAALRLALGDGGTAPSTTAAPTPTATSTSAPDADRTALADFLTRLSTTLAAGAPASLPAGSLVNVRA